MKFKLSLLSTAVLAAAGAAYAATPAPSGQMTTANQDKGPTPKASAESRAGVKADAKAAKAGDAASMPRGEMTTANQDKGPTPMPSAVSREAVKADAKAARADKPVGQDSVKDQHKGGGQAQKP